MDNSKREKLSARQAEIANFVMAGKSSREIAETLSLSPRTVELVEAGEREALAGRHLRYFRDWFVELRREYEQLGPVFTQRLQLSSTMCAWRLMAR